MAKTWKQVFLPTGAPLWLMICGYLSVILILFGVLVLLLPHSIISEVKVLKRIKQRLLRGIRRLIKLTQRGPFFRFIVFCGRKCCCGLLSSRCRVPQDLRLKPNGCKEMILEWTAASTLNPFHEELYVIAWRCQKDVASNGDWTEEDVDSNDHHEDGVKKWKFYISGLPEREALVFKLAARNVWGRSPWTEEIEEKTLARPSKDGGFTGRLGPAGQTYGDGTYFWSQTTTEVGAKIPIPDIWRSRHIRFKATAYRLQIFYKGDGNDSETQELLVGDFPRKVKADEVFWEIEDNDVVGRHISIQMQKAEKMEKWPCMIEGDGHPHIDVRQVRFWVTNDDWGKPGSGGVSFIQ